MNTDPAELIDRLRRQVNALAKHAAILDTPDDTPRIGVQQGTAAIARDALTELCEVSSPGKFSTWVDDRIAAEHIAVALCTARGPLGKNGDGLVWLDHHTARRGYDVLRYGAAHNLHDDPHLARGAALELADLLELGDEERGPFLTAQAPKHNTPRQATKRPVTVEAMHFAGDSAATHAVYKWIEDNTAGSFDPDTTPPPASGVSIDPATGQMMIATLEGVMRADVGDWVIKGVKGEFYPCKPDVFEATYDVA